MPNQGKQVRAAVEGWLRDAAIPVTSAAYRLSDKAALALSAGYLDQNMRGILHARLQKGSTTPRTGGVEELSRIAATAHEWHDVANGDPTTALRNDKFITDDGKLMANGVRSALAHRRYRKYMGSLGGYRRAFISDPAFAKSWMGLREEKRNGIFLNTSQRNIIFDALCRCAVPSKVEYAEKVGPSTDRYRLRTFNRTDLPLWAFNAEQQALVDPSEDPTQSSAPTAPRRAGTGADGHGAQSAGPAPTRSGSALESVLDRVPDALRGDMSSMRKIVNDAVSGISRVIAGRPVEDESWTSSREQLLRVQAATFYFADSYDAALYILGIVMDRLDRSPAWHGDALAAQASSIDITAEVMEVASDIVELRDVSAALRKRGLQHGVTHRNRLRELGEVWTELVDRVVALVALADAVDIVDSELVRWSDYRSVDDLDDRIDNLVARSGFRTASNQMDLSVRQDIAESGRVMAVARSVIEQEIGALGRGTHT